MRTYSENLNDPINDAGEVKFDVLFIGALFLAFTLIGVVLL